MSRSNTRRRVLQWVGGGVVGFAGCIQAGGPDEETTVNPDPDPDPGPDQDTDQDTDSGTTTADGTAPTTTVETRTFGIEVQNRLTVEDFETTEELSGPEPAVVHVRVNNLDPDDDTTYFEETVELDPGESRTFPDAFTVTFDRTTYAISVELEPFVDGGLSRDDNRKGGHTFTPGSDNMPTNDPIPVVIVSFDGEDGLFPIVGINEGN